MSHPAGFQDCIDLLNAIHEADPIVLPALIEFRVPCNDALAAHPTVQVGQNPQDVGLLGILNGLFGIAENQSGFICAEYGDDGKLIRFKQTPSTMGGGS